MLEIDPYRPLPNPGETAIIEIRPETAVIGAGVAGLTAARILAEHGYPVTVIDKGRRPGGRSATRNDDPYFFDHGCQYFTGHDRRFLRYVEAWTEQGIVSAWPARRANCLHGIVSPVEDDVLRYVGVPGMNAVARHLAKGLDVRSAIIVNAINGAPGAWTIEASEAVRETFELVVVALPAPQAVPLLAAISPLAGDARSVAMQPCWTAMAVFEYDVDAPFDAAHFSSSPLVWAANNSSKPGRAAHECWVLQASPSWTSEHIETPPDRVAELLLEAFFNDAGVAPVPPVYRGAHRWRYASPVNPLDTGFRWDEANGIGLCGDWCNRARFEGAFLSGLMLAERILDARPRATRTPL